MTAALLGVVLFCSEACLAQGLAQPVKEEMDRAWEFGRRRQYDEQLAVYDRLLADPEVKNDPLAGPIMALAV